VSCAKTAEPVEMSFVICTRMGQRNHQKACIKWGAHWRHMANTIEPSMCDGNAAFLSNYFDHLLLTRNTASTSMYSLTFCVRVMLPECHQWKPAVQAAVVMLRTPPVTRQSPATGGQQRAHTPPCVRTMSSYRRDGRKLVTRVRVMLSDF